MPETVYPAYWLSLLDARTTNKAAPTLVTDGAQVPPNRHGKFILVRLKTAATGARAATINLYGYKGLSRDSAGDTITGSAGWVDTGETWTITGSADYDQIPTSSGLLQALSAFERFDVEVTSISGTGHEVTLDLGLTEGTDEG